MILTDEAIVASRSGGGLVLRNNRYLSTANNTIHAIVETKRPSGVINE